MVRRIAQLLALGGLAAAAPAPFAAPVASLAEGSTKLDSQIPAIPTTAPHGTEPGAAPPRVSPNPTGPTTHGPYSGTPTTTGAEKAPATLAVELNSPTGGPTATYLNTNGHLASPMPLPYMPGGGVGVNGTLPRYMVASDFDFESINLGLHQEYIELDLFNNGIATFSEQDFLDAGLTAEDRAFIAFMAVQEADHATLLTNMLGPAAPKQCTYDYPFKTVREFIDFNVKLTRWGESGTWGFLSHLDSREVGTLLVQAESVEARQQMAFRQMLGLHPMPFSFVPGIPQSWHWTFLAPYISSCPQNNTRLAWQNFPALHIINQPNPNRISPNDTAPNEVVGQRIADPSNSTLPEDESCVHQNTTGYNCSPNISRNRTEPLSFPGREIFLEWEDPGKLVGPNSSYVTSTTAGTPAFVAWVSQLNLTYTPLTVTGPNSGWSYQPPNEVYVGDPAVNGTVFVAITDTDLYLTPFNLTLINPHVKALGIFNAG